MPEKQTTYNEHHPSRVLFPDFTLRLRSWMHLAVRRLEQMEANPVNFTDICSMSEAVDWVKKLMYIKLREEEDAQTSSIQSKRQESTRNHDPD